MTHMVITCKPTQQLTSLRRQDGFSQAHHSQDAQKMRTSHSIATVIRGCMRMENYFTIRNIEFKLI